MALNSNVLDSFFVAAVSAAGGTSATVSIAQCILCMDKKDWKRKTTTETIINSRDQE